MLEPDVAPLLVHKLLQAADLKLQIVHHAFDLIDIGTDLAFKVEYLRVDGVQLIAQHVRAHGTGRHPVQLALNVLLLVVESVEMTVSGLVCVVYPLEEVMDGVLFVAEDALLLKPDSGVLVGQPVKT